MKNYVIKGGQSTENLNEEQTAHFNKMSGLWGEALVKNKMLKSL